MGDCSQNSFLMWISITISHSVSSDGLLWPLCRHTHSAIWLCGPVNLTCSSCLRRSLLYTFHAERPRHRLEAGTTWNKAYRIKCFHFKPFPPIREHSSVLLYFNADQHQVICTFLNLLILQLGTLQILRPCMDSDIHFCVHKILPLNHILNHLNQVHPYFSSLFKICFHFLLPSMTVFPNYIFPNSTVYDILLLSLLHILLFHCPAFHFANATVM